VTLQHVTLETPAAEVEAEAGFWELLDFERVGTPAALGPRACWLQRDGAQIHLLLVEDPVVPPRGHPAVIAVDYERTLARLADAGLAVDHRERLWGSPRCYVRSPAGHRVEIMAYGPGG
jgi:catechol 2,3-dioxygenase-like lactoylglutathione lyase family enzyme